MADNNSLLTPINLDNEDADQADLFSLLWPSGNLSGAVTGSQLSQSAWHDLALDNIVRVFSKDPEHQAEVARVMASITSDPDVIQYRQEILQDLIDHEALVDELEKILPSIDSLWRFSYQAGKEMNTLHEVTWRMGELQSIVDCTEGLGKILDDLKAVLSSRGLCALQSEIIKIRADPTYQNLVKELPSMLSLIRTCASVTIGVNLDQFLRPVEATLLTVNEKRFTSQSMLSRLFGKRIDQMEGIVPLHSVPRREVNGAYALPINEELGRAFEPTMVPLFADLAKVIEKTTQPIARQLKKYSEMNSRMFINLRQDLIFYLGARRLIQQLQERGLPMCRPQMVDREDRLCEVDQSFNINLALYLDRLAPGYKLSEAIIYNPIIIGTQGKILILTGPNRGGKTTYMQGVAIVQVLAQLGLFVPGTRARISPVDNIYSHFPLEEKPEANTGRFGEEARRLGEIFNQVTRYSFVLLNESLSSTAPGESLYLAQDLVRILRRIGARAIYSTHLHELAEQVSELNETTPGDSKIISVVSSPVEEPQQAENEICRNYTIEVRPPLGRSYAREIALRYGISYEQLEEILRSRGVLQD